MIHLNEDFFFSFVDVASYHYSSIEFNLANQIFFFLGILHFSFFLRLYGNSVMSKNSNKSKMRYTNVVTHFIVYIYNFHYCCIHAHFISFLNCNEALVLTYENHFYFANP